MSNPISPLAPEQQAKQEARALKEGYVHRVLVGLDQAEQVEKLEKDSGGFEPPVQK